MSTVSRGDAPTLGGGGCGVARGGVRGAMADADAERCSSPMIGGTATAPTPAAGGINAAALGAVGGAGFTDAANTSTDTGGVESRRVTTAGSGKVGDKTTSSTGDTLGIAGGRCGG